MTSGYLTIAQNSSDTDYVRLAYGLALSIKTTQKQEKDFAICVNDKKDVKRKYRHAFDHIIEIPWGDNAENSDWKLENEWKAIYMSPFDETIKLDADMFFTSSVDHWWPIIRTKDMWATTNVRTFRNELVTSNYYRKAFTSNDLPNIYTAFMFFKKTPISYSVFKMVEAITKNWKEFFDHYLPNEKPRMFSTDVAFALAVKILGISSEVTQDHFLEIPTFVHMKSYIQNIDDEYLSDNWVDHIPYSVDDTGMFRIGNFNQYLPLHYHIKSCLTDDILQKLEKKLGRLTSS